MSPPHPCNRTLAATGGRCASGRTRSSKRRPRNWTTRCVNPPLAGCVPSLQHTSHCAQMVRPHRLPQSSSHTITLDAIQGESWAAMDDAERQKREEKEQNLNFTQVPCLAPLCPPGTQSQDTTHTKQPGWYVEFESRGTQHQPTFVHPCAWLNDPSQTLLPAPTLFLRHDPAKADRPNVSFPTRLRFRRSSHRCSTSEA